MIGIVIVLIVFDSYNSCINYASNKNYAWKFYLSYDVTKHVL